MSIITNASRFFLYGSDNMAKKQVSFGSALWGSTENIARRLLGLPPVATQRHTLGSWAKTGVQRQFIRVMGLERAETLPEGWPVDVFECLDRYTQAKGGRQNLGEGLSVPLLKLNRRSAVVLPSMWIAYLDFESEGANFKGLQAAEEALEDALARECGQQLNIRIMSKPARIEIDNPKPPTVRLADTWPVLAAQGPYNYALGIESTPKGNFVATNRLDNANEFSAAYFGASGSGKTQALMAAVLSLCACTSPDDLAIVLIDPKAIDFTPFAGLPHLAQPIITDAEEGAGAILDVLAEMDRRVKLGDTAAAQKRILLVVDELGDLLMQQKNDAVETALTRLAQKGRAWGFSMFLGSQRAVNESFPRSVQINLPAMIVGRVKSAGEAAFASGQPGCDAHKLPGKGAFMVYEPGADGVRVQSFFVADSNKTDYAKQVGAFVADIRSRWEGKQAHWPTMPTTTPDRINPIASVGPMGRPQGEDLRTMVQEAVRTVLLEMATVREAVKDDSTPVDMAILDTLSDELLEALGVAYTADPTKFSQRRSREIVAQFEGKRRSKEEEKAIHEAFIAYRAGPM